jgi:gas vesicle protein
MNKIYGFVSGAIMGALIGATLALLLTPYSGNDLRQQINDRAQYVQDEVKKASLERRLELEKQLSELRAPRRPGATPS